MRWSLLSGPQEVREEGDGDSGAVLGRERTASVGQDLDASLHLLRGGLVRGPLPSARAS